MAVGVVEILKLIDIQKKKSQGLSAAVRSLCFFFKLSVKMPGIIELSKVVNYAQFPVSILAFPQCFFRLLAPGNVMVVNNYCFKTLSCTRLLPTASTVRQLPSL